MNLEWKHLALSLRHFVENGWEAPKAEKVGSWRSQGRLTRVVSRLPRVIAFLET